MARLLENAQRSIISIITNHIPYTFLDIYFTVYMNGDIRPSLSNHSNSFPLSPSSDTDSLGSSSTALKTSNLTLRGGAAHLVEKSLSPKLQGTSELDAIDLAFTNKNNKNNNQNRMSNGKNVVRFNQEEETPSLVRIDSGYRGDTLRVASPTEENYDEAAQREYLSGLFTFVITIYFSSKS